MVWFELGLMTSLSGYISSLFLTFSSISFQFLKNDKLRCATKFNFASKPWLWIHANQ